jgi:hypothetical protein
VTTITIVIQEDTGRLMTLVFEVDSEKDGQYVINHERDVEVHDDESGGPLSVTLPGSGKIQVAAKYTREIRVPRPNVPMGQA